MPADSPDALADAAGLKNIQGIDINMKIKFVGAAGGSVTGSCTHFFYPRTKTSFLVDCGLVQGEGDFESINTAPFPFDAAAVQFVLLTHAHLDHCGLLPKLYRAGFTGEVICTAATAELARLSLLDSAGYQGSLFTHDEVKQIRFKPIEGQPSTAGSPMFPVRKDLFVSFRRTAHIVGACSITIGWLDDKGKQRYLVMSGDLGNNTKDNLYQPLLAHRRSIFGNPDAIVVESTYGDRCRLAEHQSYEARIEALRDLVQREVFDRKSVLVVPAFALQRTQEFLVDLVVVLKRFFSSATDAAAPYLPRGRFYDDFSDGCWTRVAHAAFRRLLPALQEEQQARWADAFEDTGDAGYPYRLRAGHPGTADAIRSLIESHREPYPVDVVLDSKLGRRMGAILGQELLRRTIHKPEEFAHRNPELMHRLGTESEQEFESLIAQLMPSSEEDPRPIAIGPHTIQFRERTSTPSKESCVERGAILITGGGMCDGGPVLAHLEKLATQKRECVLVQTGFMAKYSLGRRLFDIAKGNGPGQQKPDAKISLGAKVDIPSADIHIRAADLSAYYSGHADQAGLLDFIFTTDGRTPGGLSPIPATVFINHGHSAARTALQEAIEQRKALGAPNDRPIKTVELPATDMQAYDLCLGQWVSGAEVQSSEEMMAALLREQVKTNELLRQILQFLNRPSSEGTKGKYVKK